MGIKIHKKMTFSKQGLVSVKQKKIKKLIVWLKIMESVKFSSVHAPKIYEKLKNEILHKLVL